LSFDSLNDVPYSKFYIKTIKKHHMNIVIIGGGFVVLILLRNFKSKGVQLLLIKTTIIFSAAYLSTTVSSYRYPAGKTFSFVLKVIVVPSENHTS
jgi:NADH dehydrogenase FAD-containing subunit